MKRRTVVLAIEIEGIFPDALDLRDAIMRETSNYYWRVRQIEIADDGIDVRRRAPSRDTPPTPATRQ